MKSDSWLQDKYVKNWFEQIGSERTKTNYKREFPKFLEWIKQTPSEIIESRLQHLTTTNIAKRQFWEQQLIKYMHFLEGKGLRSDTIKGYLRSVQSFFSHNGCKFLFARGQLKPEPTEKEKTERKWVATNEEIRKVYRYAKTPRDRSLILIMYQSGFLPADIENMKIENFSFYDKDGKWQIPETEHYYHYQRREKTNEYQCTMISYEAIADIKMMLSERGFPQKGRLFVSFRDKPLDAREINLAIKSIVERAFPHKIKQWKTKNLRDSYDSALLAGQIPQEHKRLMMGHKRRGSESRYGTPESLEPAIREAYKTVWRFLAVNGFGTPSHKVDLLEKEFREKYSELGELVGELRSEIKTLEEEREKDRDEMMALLYKLQKSKK